jgi:hypothetical protein
LLAQLGQHLGIERALERLERLEKPSRRHTRMIWLSGDTSKRGWVVVIKFGGGISDIKGAAG